MKDGEKKLPNLERQQALEERLLRFASAAIDVAGSVVEARGRDAYEEKFHELSS